MSLDKAIARGKEKRRPYYRAGRHDRTCRPGGSCPWCRENRTIQERRARTAAEDQQRELDSLDGFP